MASIKILPDETGRCFTLRQTLRTILDCILLFFILLLTCPSVSYCSDILKRVDVIENLRFNSYSSDGKHFIFTRWDSTGNKYELIFYDLKNKKELLLVRDLPSGAVYVHSDDKYIVIRKGYLNNELLIIKRDNLSSRKTIKLTGKLKGIFTNNHSLYLIQSESYNKDQLCRYDLSTLSLLSKNEIVTSYSYDYHYIDNKIIGIGKNIVTYDDKALLPIHETDNKMLCQYAFSGTAKRKLYFSDKCGVVYEYDPGHNERKVIFDFGALSIKTGLHVFESLLFDISENGLLVAQHSNKESYPKLVDLKSGRLLKTLEVEDIPNYIMIIDEMLYFIYRPERSEKKSRIEVYKIDKGLLYSDAFYADTLKHAYDRSTQTYRDTKDPYKAIDILETADIQLMIKGQRQYHPDLKLDLIKEAHLPTEWVT